MGDGLQNMIIKKGQVIVFDIKYGGEPEPEVTWKKADKHGEASLHEDSERYALFYGLL